METEQKIHIPKFPGISSGKTRNEEITLAHKNIIPFNMTPLEVRPRRNQQTIKQSQANNSAESEDDLDEDTKETEITLHNELKTTSQSM